MSPQEQSKLDARLAMIAEHDQYHELLLQVELDKHNMARANSEARRACENRRKNRPPSGCKNAPQPPQMEKRSRRWKRRSNMYRPKRGK
jgi:hypothetical protein